MPKPKPWPHSESEFTMSFSAAIEAAEIARTDRALAPLAADAIRAHNIATCAVVELRSVAERYYTAAGFRE